MTSIAPRFRAALALGVAWLVFFGVNLIDVNGVPYFRDTMQLYIPVRAFLHESLKSGRLPEWFPYELTGVPFIGQIVTATFHPQTLLFLPFAPAIAVKLNILTAFLFGEVGAYRLGRALGCSRSASVVSAFTLAFGGYAVGNHHNQPYLLSQVTLPWVAWAALGVVQRGRTRDVAALAFTWALIFLGVMRKDSVSRLRWFWLHSWPRGFHGAAWRCSHWQWCSHPVSSAWSSCRRSRSTANPIA